MKTITPFELQILIDKRDVELIDVRPKKDFKAVHALGARSIPLSRFEPHSILAHRELDRRAPLYIMSRERALASLAACSLAGAGLAEPIVVDGGIQEWEGQCLPVVRNKPWRMPVMNILTAVLNKQIAAETHTAEKTIKVHRGRVMQKLGVTSVPDLVRISQRAGISPARNPA
jgi:rhodanese-related sulfurtransferase